MGWFDEPSKDAYSKGRGKRKIRFKGGRMDGQTTEVHRLDDSLEVGGETYDKVGGSMFGEETVTYKLREKKKGW